MTLDVSDHDDTESKNESLQWFTWFFLSDF